MLQRPRPVPRGPQSRRTVVVVLLSLFSGLAAALAAAPANDNFANAIVLTGTNLSTTGSNVGATPEAGEPVHWPGGSSPTNSVWWKWTAPGTGVVQINTTNSTFDTILAVYTGSAVSSLSVVASNDDF